MIRSSAASVVSFFLLQQHVSSSSSCYDLVMNDDWGDGWGPDPAAVVTITSTNLNASLSDGTTATENICLEDGCYTLRVSKDEYPAEVSWTFGETLSGGANSTTNFTAISGTIVAGCTCSEMRMYDDWGDGWGESEYSIVRSTTSEIAANGTLRYGYNRTDTICLTEDCYTFMVSTSEYASEISWDFGALFQGGAPFGPKALLVNDGTTTEVAACSTESPTISVPPSSAPTVSLSPTILNGGAAETLTEIESLVESSEFLVTIQLVANISFDREMEIVNGTRRIFEATTPTSRRLSSSPEATTVILDGMESNRIFRVSGGELIVRGPITLTNGYADYGGAIIVQYQGLLELTDVTITNCVADEGAAIYLEGFIVPGSFYEPTSAILTNVNALDNLANDFAGVVYSQQSNLVIVGGRYADNAAYACGAFFARKSRLSVVGAEFSSNAAETYGGVLCAQYSTLSDAVQGASHNLTDCDIFSNEAAWQAGVVYNDESEVTVTNSVVRDNLAGLDGGVFYEYFGVATSLIGGSYIRNFAMNDGGVIATADLYVGSVYILNALVRDNGAALDGGVVKASFGARGTSTLRGGTFIRNSAVEGGVVYVAKGSLSVESAKFAECAAEYGAVIYTTLGDVSVNSSTFERNNATFGGVIAVDEAQTAILFTNCNASSNKATAQGGVVYCGRDSCNVNGSSTTLFYGNQAVEGSAIYVPADAVGILSGLALTSNVAIFSGAIYVGLGSTTSISDVLSSDNVAFDSGAFAYCASLSTVTIAGITSTGDAAELSGVIYVGIRASAVVSDSTFFDARSKAGTVYAVGTSSLAVTNVNFRNARALASGAALFAQSFESVTVISCVFEGNEAIESGAIFLDSGTSSSAEVSLQNVTAFDNKATDGGFLVAKGAALRVLCVRVNATANVASAIGGVGILADGARLYASHGSLFSSNVAMHAGAFSLESGSFLKANETSFIFNAATSGSGGVLSIETNATVEILDNVDMSDNAASAGGGGVVFYDYTSTEEPDISRPSLFRNTALYGDIKASNTASIEIDHDTPQEASGAEFRTSIKVRTVDALGQIVKTAEPERVYLSSPYDDNTTLDGTTKLTFEQGVAETVSFVVFYDAAGGFVPISASLKLKGRTLIDTKQVYIRPCTYGEHWNALGRTCERCGSNLFSFDPRRECKACVGNADCPGGFQMLVKKGYWRSNRNSENVRKCMIEDHCLGDVNLWNASLSNGDNLQCAEHHKGPLCATCRGGYAFDAHQDCVVCPNNAKTWAAIGVFLSLLSVVTVVLAGLAYAFYVTQRRTVEKIQAFVKKRYDALCETSIMSWTKFKLLIIHWQTLSAQMMMFNFIRYPKSASYLRILGLDLLAVLSMGFCRSDYLNRLWTITILPCLVLGAIYLRHRIKRRKTTGEEDDETLHQLRAGTVTLVLTVTFIIYTNVSAGVFNSLRCDYQFQRIDGESNSRYRGQSYLIADYSIRCNSIRYKVHEVYAYLLVLIYPIGIPLMYVVVLANQLGDINPSRERTKLIAQGIIAESKGEAPPRNVPRLSYHPLPDDDPKQQGKPPESLVKLAKDFLGLVEALGINNPGVIHGGQRLIIEQRAANRGIAPLKMLYHDYMPRYWYFEAIMCVWRLLLTCVLPAFIRPKNQLGLLYGTTLLTFAYCVMIIMMQPYADPGTNFAASLLASLSTVTMTLTVWWFVESNLEGDVNAGWSTTMMTASLVVMNILGGPLSLFFDLGQEFNIFGVAVATFIGVFAFHLRNREDEDKSSVKKYAIVIPVEEEDENDQKVVAEAPVGAPPSSSTKPVRE